MKSDMISEDITPVAKRLKRYDQQQSTLCSRTDKMNSNNLSGPANVPAGLDRPDINKTRVDTQDILAKACNAIGLDSSMMDLVETPNRIDQKAKHKKPRPISGYTDKFNNGHFPNGQGNCSQTYYTNPKPYMSGYPSYNNGCKEQIYPWNKYPARKLYHIPPQDRMQPHYLYPKNQYMWHSLNKSQTHPQQPFINRPYFQTQQPTRLSYNNGINRVSHSNIQPNYTNPEDKGHQLAYQRNISGQIAPAMNSCRFSQPNYSTLNNQYPQQTSLHQQETNFQPNKAYYGYMNGYPQHHNNIDTINKRIPGFENFSTVDAEKNSISQYSPISSPILPNTNPQNAGALEKHDHLPNSQIGRNVCIPFTNKSINNGDKTENRKCFPNDYYRSSSYKEECSDVNNIRQSNRRHSYMNGYGLNCVEKNQHSFAGNQDFKQVYLPDGNQLNFPNTESACSYNVYDYNATQTQVMSENARSKEYNNYNNCQDTNNFPYQNNSEPKLIPIDYSLYGTDEIIKNSVKIPKPNLPHSPNIELIPLEGTSIISNLSNVSNKNLPEISINSIKCISAKENESFYQKESYSSNSMSNVNTSNYMHNKNNVNCIVNNEGVRIDDPIDNKESVTWYERESAQCSGIPELTSISDTEIGKQVEYRQSDTKKSIEGQRPLLEDQVANENYIMARPLKIEKILNSNFLGMYSKQRPSSEPLLKQNWQNLEDMQRPLSVPVNNIDSYCENTLNLLPEEKIKINNFQQKLKPVLEHLLSIPEASSLLSLRENPKELLKHLVKLWGGQSALSCSKVPLINIKENFLMLVKLLFKATLLLEWGWQNATADRILDDLVKQAEGFGEYRASMDILSLACPPNQDPLHGTVMHTKELCSISDQCTSPFINE